MANKRLGKAPPVEPDSSAGAGAASASDSVGAGTSMLEDANTLVPKLLRLEDGYWEQLANIATELSALRHERVGVNSLIREVLIESLELRPPPEIQTLRESARKAYEARIAEIDGKRKKGGEAALSVRDRMFYEAVKRDAAAKDRRKK